MSDLYKLVFRGEVLEGQHPAVVRKRLAESASFDEAALDKLFSGRPVVLKREADTATAARLQGMFKKAGARLRVLPVEGDDELAPPPAAAGAPAATEPAAPRPPVAQPAETGDSLELLPAGSDILRTDERTPWQPRDVDTGDLALQGARFPIPDEPDAPAGPDVSHLTLAQTGSDLGPSRPPPEQLVQAPELPLAEAGADLGPRAAPTAPVVDFDTLQFEVAPAGTDLGQRKGAAAPPAPDTSHLTLSDPDA